MSKLLYGLYDSPDMRRAWTAETAARELVRLNPERIAKARARLVDKKGRPLIPKNVSNEQLVALAIRGTMEKEGTTKVSKEILTKALRSNTLMSAEERYKLNMINILKNSQKFDDFRRMTGWNKKIDLDQFEYDESRGGLVYMGMYIIKHEDDYFQEDGLEILSLVDYDAYGW